MATTTTSSGMATMSSPQHFMETSGETDSVWIHTDPYSNRPQFKKLSQDLKTDVCIIGAGIAGISTAYELVRQGVNVVMIEARQVLSGETGRTSGHLSSFNDDGFTELASTHGEEEAQMYADSHTWAANRVGQIAQELGIECEYRHLPSYEVSQYPVGHKNYESDIKELKEESDKAASLGLKASFTTGVAIKGWDGKTDQRDAAVTQGQATFHPTKYLNGLLKWLSKQNNFSCYTYTRVMGIEEKGIEILGIGSKEVKITTEGGNTITCKNALEATNVPLQKLSLIAEMEYNRTYCIAMRIPKGTYEDCLVYDSADPYMYVRFTECDEKDDYLVIGGCDHKVGQEEPTGRFEKLERWTRERWTQVGSVDYKWSGQVFEPVDDVAFIGTNQGNDHIYVITGDSGNGLTHGVLASRIISDQMLGRANPWTKLYNPSRIGSILKNLPSLLQHDLQINAQYKRFLESDIKDIEDLPNGMGGVLNPTLSKPVAVYKDDAGKVHTFSALCPHMKGVVCWNKLEKSWDCPVHGSRFSKDGICVIGPSKGNLVPEDENGKAAQRIAIEG